MTEYNPEEIQRAVTAADGWLRNATDQVDDALNQLAGTGSPDLEALTAIGSLLAGARTKLKYAGLIAQRTHREEA